MLRFNPGESVGPTTLQKGWARGITIVGKRSKSALVGQSITKDNQLAVFNGMLHGFSLAKGLEYQPS
jgi:hypothetical protein